MRLALTTRQKVELFLESNDGDDFLQKPTQPINESDYIIPKQYIIDELNLDTRPLNMIMICVTKENQVFSRKTVFLTEKLTITEDEEKKLMYSYDGNTMQEQEFIKYINLIHFK